MVNAVLNVGWCKDSESEDWIHSGDYHSEIQVDFDVPKEGDSFSLDYPVVKFLTAKGNNIFGTLETESLFLLRLTC